VKISKRWITEIPGKKGGNPRKEKELGGRSNFKRRPQETSGKQGALKGTDPSGLRGNRRRRGNQRRQLLGCRAEKKKKWVFAESLKRKEDARYIPVKLTSGGGGEHFGMAPKKRNVHKC